MVKYIPNNQIIRLFPYPFFKDLNDNLLEYIIENKHFLYQNTSLDSLVDYDTPELQFENFRKKMLNQELQGVKMEKYNLYSIDQGQFLILDQFIKRQDRIKFIKDEPVDRYAILVQIFDKDEKPLLTSSQRLKDIRQIKPVNLSDNHVALLIVKLLSADDPDVIDKKLELGVIKAPPYYLDKLLDSSNVERDDK